MKYLKDWKVHAFCFGMVLASELIGAKPFKFGPIGFTLLPMLYALIIGIILAKMKLITMEMMTTAVPYITISVMYLTAKMSSTVGPNLSTVLSAGPALLVTAVTKKLAVPLLAVPVGVLIFKMGRQAVGCGFSTSREDAIAIIGNMYGLDSPEGQGVMGGYITGTLLGTIFNGLMASLFCSMGFFHPFALAIGAAVGSSSMMAACMGAIVEAYPQYADQIQAYTAGGQVLGSVTGMYVTLFLALPLANFMYRICKREPKPAKEATSNKAE